MELGTESCGNIGVGLPRMSFIRWGHWSIDKRFRHVRTAESGLTSDSQ